MAPFLDLAWSTGCIISSGDYALKKVLNQLEVIWVTSLINRKIYPPPQTSHVLIKDTSLPIEIN